MALASALASSSDHAFVNVPPHAPQVNKPAVKDCGPAGGSGSSVLGGIVGLHLPHPSHTALTSVDRVTIVGGTPRQPGLALVAEVAIGQRFVSAHGGPPASVASRPVLGGTSGWMCP